MVISLLLGVPYTDHEFFQTITGKLMNMYTSPEEKAKASREFFGYMLELVARKEREPGDDLLSRVIREHVQTGELRRETAAMNGVILLNAGHETTANMIALGTVALLENPDLAAAILSNTATVGHIPSQAGFTTSFWICAGTLVVAFATALLLPARGRDS
ncbi:hypothetical protein ABZ897_35235 [Nonomuraea sp. NPDC046802]|uniref:hypothetical protein n=1 Tax=Nonomuraea sp. NPDC046802 TaxID=3154919 RepID=UPI0033CEB4B1